MKHFFNFLSLSLLFIFLLVFNQVTFSQADPLNPVQLDSVVTEPLNSVDITAIDSVKGTSVSKSKVPDIDSSPYKLKPAVDIPVTAVGTGLSLYGFYLISEKSSSSESEIMNLDRDDINGFDRPATREFSENANNASDYFMYGALPLPFIVALFDDEMRSDFWKISFLFLEAMAIDGTAYTQTAGNIDRYRPLAYNPEAPLSERKRGNTKNSFIGGHPSVTATAGFFIAKVYSDYHPESDFKYALYGFATVATAGNAYLRYKAGKHFPSDLIVGAAFGTLTGILVPHFHKKGRKKSFSVIPFSGDVHGLSMTYRFK